MFAEAGELAVSASYGFSGTEGQLAYAITDHIAMMANVNAKWSNLETAESDPAKQRHFFGEGGLGYYTTQEAVRFELFGGYGVGKSMSKASAIMDFEERLAQGMYRRIFIQPSIGTNNERFNIIFSPRISWVSFTKFSPYPDQSYSFLLKPGKAWFPFFEPALTGRFPMGKVLHGYFQIGANVAFQDYYYYYNYSTLNFTLGLQLRTGLLYKDGN
ncbi:MAG: hypothetical protein WDO15_06900 [Bacteroidota bacterium]